MITIAREILVSAKGGDKAAVEAVLAALEPTLRRMACKIARYLDQDDVMQMARIKIWHEINTIDLARWRRVPGYLLWIAANEMREEVRRDKVRRPVNFTDVSLTPTGERKRGSEGERDYITPVRSAPPVVPPTESLDRALSNVLRQYLKHIRLMATMRGAHTVLDSGAFRRAAGGLRARYSGPAELLPPHPRA